MPSYQNKKTCVFVLVLVVGGCTDKLENTSAIAELPVEATSDTLSDAAPNSALISYELLSEPKIGEPLTVQVSVDSLAESDYRVALQPNDGIELGSSQERGFELAGGGSTRSFNVVIKPLMEGRSYLGVSLVTISTAGRVQLATQIPIQIGPLSPYRPPELSSPET